MAKNVIVTGASRGIGFELVQKYAEAGHEVIAISRNSVRLEKLKEAELRKLLDRIPHNLVQKSLDDLENSDS